MSKALIVAAEISSGIYAQRLLAEWKSQNQNISAFGIGTQGMEELGFRRIGKAEEMAVFGFAEVVHKYNFLKSVFWQVVEEAKKQKPQVAILMDYPGFNLRLAEELKKLGIPVVYYISPQIWAWKQGRIKAIKKYVDKMLVVFPFEVDFYQKHGVQVEFVGHPLLDELDPKFEDFKNINLQRSRCGVSEQEVLLGLMPGSRFSELKYNFPTQLAVARRIHKNYGRIRLAILVAPNLQKEDLLPYLEDFRTPYMLLKEEPAAMISMMDLILATSGTATLLVGLLAKPMVIMYKVHWLTAIIAKLLVRGIKYFGLVNLITNKELVPERFQGQATEDELYFQVEKFLKDQEYRLGVQNELKQVRHMLGDRGASKRVAQSLKEYLHET